MSLNYLVAAARERSELVKKNRVMVKKEVKQTLDFSSEIEQAARNPEPQWTECKHLKTVGERKFCKCYLTLCAQEKCSSKYINADENEIDYKGIIKGK